MPKKSIISPYGPYIPNKNTIKHIGWICLFCAFLSFLALIGCKCQQSRDTCLLIGRPCHQSRDTRPLIGRPCHRPGVPALASCVTGLPAHHVTQLSIYVVMWDKLLSGKKIVSMVYIRYMVMVYGLMESWSLSIVDWKVAALMTPNMFTLFSKTRYRPLVSSTNLLVISHS